MKPAHLLAISLLAALFLCPNASPSQASAGADKTDYYVCFAVVKSNTAYTESITQVFPAPEKDYFKVGDAFRQYAKSHSLFNGSAPQCQKFPRQEDAVGDRANTIDKVKNYMHKNIVEIDWVYQ